MAWGLKGNSPARISPGPVGRILSGVAAGSAGGGGSGGHVIQDEGTPLTARANLNFVGAGVVATDDAGNNATKVTIGGGGGAMNIGDAIGGGGTATRILFEGAGPVLADSAGLAYNSANSRLLLSGTGVAAGILIGGDALLYRSSANVLWTPSDFVTEGAVTAAVLVTADTLIATSLIRPNTNGSAALGTTALQFSNLFLKEGGVINWDNGDATLTQVGDVVTLAGAELKITTPGNVSTSVLTTDGVQELTSKTLTSAVGKGTWTVSGTWTLPAFTAGGDIQLSENISILLDAALSADGKWSGLAETGTLGETVAFGEICYFKVADSKWWKAKADAAATSGGVKLAVCVVAGVANDVRTVMLIGKIRADSLYPTLTVGAAVYLSAATAGQITNTQPSATDQVIIILGFGNTGDELYFNPSFNWMTHT